MVVSASLVGVVLTALCLAHLAFMEKIVPRHVFVRMVLPAVQSLGTVCVHRASQANTANHVGQK